MLMAVWIYIRDTVEGMFWLIWGLIQMLVGMLLLGILSILIFPNDPGPDTGITCTIIDSFMDCG